MLAAQYTKRISLVCTRLTSHIASAVQNLHESNISGNIDNRHPPTPTQGARFINPSSPRFRLFQHRPLTRPMALPSPGVSAQVALSESRLERQCTQQKLPSSSCHLRREAATALHLTRLRSSFKIRSITWVCQNKSELLSDGGQQETSQHRGILTLRQIQKRADVKTLASIVAWLCGERIAVSAKTPNSESQREARDLRG